MTLASTRGEVWGGQESDVASVEEKSERRGEVGDGGGVAFEEGDGRGVGVGEMGDDFGFTGSVVVLWGDTAVVGEHFLFGFW